MGRYTYKTALIWIFPEVTTRRCMCSSVHVWFHLSNVYGYRLPQGSRIFLTTCRKEAEASFPLPLTGPYRLGSATLSNRLAASRSYNSELPTHVWFNVTLCVEPRMRRRRRRRAAAKTRDATRRDASFARPGAFAPSFCSVCSVCFLPFVGTLRLRLSHGFSCL